jgi:SanA protein
MSALRTMMSSSRSNVRSSASRSAGYLYPVGPGRAYRVDRSATVTAVLARLPLLPALSLAIAHRALAALGGALVLLVLAANAYIVISTRGDATSEIAALPHAQAAIVPGAQVYPDGTMSSMLADRVRRTVELWEANKVDRILVSGGHGSWGYDEPDTMRRALMRAGVPGHVIFTDHAGFNTRATMVRAKRIFQVSSAIVVTQGFHMDRALYLAKAAGIEVHGLTSDLHGYGQKKLQSGIREIFARVKAIGDEALGSEVMGGPPIPITGDGRASWGPKPAPGAPPAGALKD